MSSSFNSSTPRVQEGRLPDGTKALFVGGECVHCSADLALFQKVFPAPSGRILMGGLGLGLDTKYILSFEEVSKLVVLELEPDIIALWKEKNPVQDPRLELVQGDFFSVSHDGFNLVINTCGVIERF